MRSQSGAATLTDLLTRPDDPGETQRDALDIRPARRHVASFAMKRQVVAAVAVAWSVTGCGPAGSVLHGYHRYTQPGLAMEPTVRRGQTFNARPVEHGRYQPKRGDVVVFIMPSWTAGKQAPDLKRVVAIAGDKIACCSNGKVVLNGTPLPEPYLAPNIARSGTATFGPVTVPSGSLWVMGDNRPYSADSRLPDHGPIPATAVIAVAVLE